MINRAKKKKNHEIIIYTQQNPQALVVSNRPIRFLPTRQQLHGALRNFAFLSSVRIVNALSTGSSTTPPAVNNYFANANCTTDYLVQGDSTFTGIVSDFVRNCGANVNCVVSAVNYNNIFNIQGGTASPWLQLYRGAGQAVDSVFEGCLKDQANAIDDGFYADENEVVAIVGGVLGGIAVLLVCIGGMILIVCCCVGLISKRHEINEKKNNFCDWVADKKSERKEKKNKAYIEPVAETELAEVTSESSKKTAGEDDLEADNKQTKSDQENSDIESTSSEDEEQAADYSPSMRRGK